MKWLHKLEEDYVCDLSKYLDKQELNQIKNEIVSDQEFSDKGYRPRLKLTSNGEIIVYKGYAWDGNSPKVNFLDLLWLGTPDGLLDGDKPITYYASLIHDVLGQFKADPKMPSKFRSTRSPDLWLSSGRKGRDSLYFNMLEEADFMWRHIYYLAVVLFGPLYDMYLSVFKGVDFHMKFSRNITNRPQTLKP